MSDDKLARRLYPGMSGDRAKAPLPRATRTAQTRRAETREERMARLLFPSMRAVRPQ